jgi:hypothetical protein
MGPSDCNNPGQARLCALHALLHISTQVIEAGANAIVAGSAVFKAKSYKDGEFGIA